VTKEGSWSPSISIRSFSGRADAACSQEADVGLGSSAVVQYTKQGDKNVATSVVLQLRANKAAAND